MGGVVRFLLGLAIGAAAGYAAGLLLTPESGEENVRQVREWIDSAIAEGKQAAAERQRTLEAELAQGSQRPGV